MTKERTPRYREGRNPLLRRIRVVDPCGSDKSHLGRRLSESLKIPYTEIDSIYWASDDTDSTKPRAAEERNALCDKIS